MLWPELLVTPEVQNHESYTPKHSCYKSLIYGLWSVSGLSSLKHTFPLHPLRMYIISYPPPILLSCFLGLFGFSCNCLACLTFPSLCTRSNAEIMLLWYVVAGVFQERVAAGWSLQQITAVVVPLPFCKALSGCSLVFTHLGRHFPSGRADICQKARTSAPMP